MIFLGLFAATTLITLSKATPLSYGTYRRRGDGDEHRAYIPYIVDGSSVNDNIYWPSQLQEEPDLKSFNNSENGFNGRVKRIRSLSVTNSLDVLRQRVLLELARRKALQDQKQIDANRRFLDNIGKRSSSQFDSGKSPQIFDTNQEEKQITTEPKNFLHRTFDWYGFGEVADPYNDDDQLSKMDTNDLRLF